MNTLRGTPKLPRTGCSRLNGLTGQPKPPAAWVWGAAGDGAAARCGPACGARPVGSLGVRHGDVILQLGRPMQRALLALLLVDAGRAVSTARLIDALWGEQPPRTAPTSLQNFVSQLRKLLGPELLVTKPP